MSIFTPAHHAVAEKYPYEIRLHGNVMEFQPRDGTRYRIVFTSLPPEAQRALGCSHNGVLVTLMRGSNDGVSACFDWTPHESYLREKFGTTNEHTNKMVCRALRFFFTEADIGPFQEAA